jgi:hypothetical protein
LQYFTALADSQNKTTATTRAKGFEYALRDKASQFWNDWDTKVVQQGESTENAVLDFEQFFKDQRGLMDAAYGEEAKKNPYAQEALDLAYDHVYTDTMMKARTHARTSFIDITHKKTDAQGDMAMNQALLAESIGDYEGYQQGVQGWLAHLDTLEKSGAYNHDQIVAKKEAFKETVETKRAYQVVARDPQGFLDGNENHEFDRLEPKLRSELVTHADKALDAKVTRAEHRRKVEKENNEFYAQSVMSEIIGQAIQDPGAAYARLQNQETRLALGTHYDDTVGRVREYLKSPLPTDKDTRAIGKVKREIELNPTQGTYGHVDALLYSHKIDAQQHATMFNRITERIHSLKTETEQVRTKLIKEAVDTFQPMLRVTGINDFDGTSSDAQQNFQDELFTNLRNDPKLDPQTEGRRLMLKYRDYVADRYLDVTGAIVEKYNVKSPGDVIKLYEAKQISRTESDQMLWYFSNADKVSTPASSPTKTSSVVKKK